MSGKRLIPVQCGLSDVAGVSRRGFLGGTAVGVGGALAADMRAVNGLRAEEIAGELRRPDHRIVLVAVNVESMESAVSCRNLHM